MNRLIDFIVSDDIRQEVSGKITLVGVYPDGIVGRTSTPEQPGMLQKLGIFMRLVVDEENPPDEFKIRGLVGGEEFASFEGTMTIGNSKRPITLAVVSGPFPLLLPGLQFELTLSRKGEVVDSLRPMDVPISFSPP
jgi:hypothetical protein